MGNAHPERAQGAVVKPVSLHPEPDKISQDETTQRALQSAAFFGLPLQFKRLLAVTLLESRGMEKELFFSFRLGNQEKSSSGQLPYAETNVSFDAVLTAATAAEPLRLEVKQRKKMRPPQLVGSMAFDLSEIPEDVEHTQWVNIEPEKPKKKKKHGFDMMPLELHVQCKLSLCMAHEFVLRTSFWFPGYFPYNVTSSADDHTVFQFDGQLYDGQGRMLINCRYTESDHNDAVVFVQFSSSIPVAVLNAPRASTEEDVARVVEGFSLTIAGVPMVLNGRVRKHDYTICHQDGRKALSVHGHTTTQFPMRTGLTFTIGPGEDLPLLVAIASALARCGDERQLRKMQLDGTTLPKYTALAPQSLPK
eukprot:TRINITY_DN7813_c0_g1_i1.p1 TRINITY_DN7813_c0_g1~~TRINITY_DN7813_c0_g1_i1.p1  ORF type:complete len:363 (+),score=103.47 TRINITY_DN7813_c0_g1_i1:99-1187(+)